MLTIHPRSILVTAMAVIFLLVALSVTEGVQRPEFPIQKNPSPFNAIPATWPIGPACAARSVKDYLEGFELSDARRAHADLFVSVWHMQNDCDTSLTGVQLDQHLTPEQVEQYLKKREKELKSRAGSSQEWAQLKAKDPLFNCTVLQEMERQHNEVRCDIVDRCSIPEHSDLDETLHIQLEVLRVHPVQLRVHGNTSPWLYLNEVTKNLNEAFQSANIQFTANYTSVFISGAHSGNQPCATFSTTAISNPLREYQNSYHAPFDASDVVRSYFKAFRDNASLATSRTIKVLLMYPHEHWIPGASYHPCDEGRRGVIAIQPTYSMNSRLLVHEIGHILGLRHSDERSNAMCPYVENGISWPNPFTEQQFRIMRCVARDLFTQDLSQMNYDVREITTGYLTSSCSTVVNEEGNFRGRCY